MCGGGAAANKGYFIQPTVFGDVQDNMTIAREEVGGLNAFVMLFLGRCLLWLESTWDGRDMWATSCLQEVRGVAGLRSERISSIFCCRFLVQWCKSWSSSPWRRWWNEPMTPNMVWQQLCSLRTSIRRIIYPTGCVQAPSGTQYRAWFYREFSIIDRKIIHHSVQVKMKLKNRLKMKKLYLILLRYSILVICITLNVHQMALLHRSSSPWSQEITFRCFKAFFTIETVIWIFLYPKSLTFLHFYSSHLFFSAGLTVMTCLGPRLHLGATRLQESAESWENTDWTTTPKSRR